MLQSILARFRRAPLPMAPTLAHAPIRPDLMDWPEYDGPPAVKIDASPVPVPVERVEPVAKPNPPAKRAARPRDAVAPSATSGDWAILSKANREFFERVMPWVFDGRTPVRSPAEYLKLHKDGTRKLGRRKPIPVGTGDWSLCPLNSMPFQRFETEREWKCRLEARRAAEAEAAKPQPVELPMAA